MRLILGLDGPNRGRVTVNGRPYAQHHRPMFEVGALLEGKAVHGGRSAYNHLLCLAASNGIGRARVAEVLELVGLEGVARKRAGGFSLGMTQRLGIAVALLGDPGTLMFDEPVNGLDPEGILWVRNLLKRLAAEGRTVFVSSHLMAEMSLTADHLIVIGKGRLIADASVQEVVQRSSGGTVRVRSPRAGDLDSLLRARGASVLADGDGVIRVGGMSAAEIGDAAAEAGLALHELTPEQASLEDAFMELTRESVQFHAGDGRTPARPDEPR